MVIKNFNQAVFLFREGLYNIFSLKAKAYSMKILTLKFTIFFISNFLLVRYIKKSWKELIKFFMN